MAWLLCLCVVLGSLVRQQGSWTTFMAALRPQGYKVVAAAHTEDFNPELSPHHFYCPMLIKAQAQAQPHFEKRALHEGMNWR